ncbi:TPA: hypothetical protein HA344_02520 [Candidatus Bathyarchaeota archaeon]|nr:hypothetical protein [Candidatus Bathyarchaeota archaeon]
MMPVAVSGGVALHCPDDGRYAFFNSPYPAHRLMTGLDIYPNTENNSSFPSPVSGAILQVRQVKAPRGHGFEAPEQDVVTIIGSGQSPGVVVKLLHVDTRVEVGDEICVGEPLGPLVRSGYFGYHTPLHAHIEVRPADDPIRVRGAHTMNSLLDLEGLEATEELTGTVLLTRKGFAQIRPIGTPRVVVDVGGSPGIIDGGIPLYGWFGTHTQNAKPGTSVRLLGKEIGIVRKVGPHTCIADCTKFNAHLGEIPVDMFFVLTPMQQTVVAVTSKKRGELDLNAGNEVSVTVS